VREKKGKLPSQPVPNPKAFAIGNSSHSAHKHEQVQSIVTLRLERQVDDKVVQEEEDPVVPQGEESGRDKGKKLSLLEPYPLLKDPLEVVYPKSSTSREIESSKEECIVCLNFGGV
jgi:hypothetical protein